MTSVRTVAAIFAALSIAGCGTVKGTVGSVTGVFGSMRPDYSQVPEADLRSLAAQIEREIAAGNRDAQIAPQGALNIDRDTIKQAIRTRAARYELISTLLDSGFAWERKSGLVAILRSREYSRAGTRRSRDRDAMLVMGENNDRWTIYEELLKQNNLPPRALDAVQVIFRDARREILKPGQKYETESGDVAVK